MRKTAFCLACVIIYLITALSCEIPESITIKGSPGVHVPLGSPFASLDDEDRLESHLSSEKIREMMNSGGEDVEIYEYLPNTTETLQQYISHYLLIDEELPYTDVGFTIPDHFKPIGQDYVIEKKPITIQPSLTGFLGDGVTFKEAWGYIYVSGMDSDAKITLTYSNGDVEDEPLDGISNSELTSLTTYPQFPESTDIPFTTIPTHSLSSNPSKINFTPILNAKSASTLKCKITISGEFITSGTETKEIRADLIIHLPLKFQVENQFDNSDYVKLDLKDVLPELGGSDLFGRNDNSNMFDQIDSVTIYLKNIKNTIIGNNQLAILVTSGIDRELLDFNQSVPCVTFINVPKPFTPRFEIVLKKDSGENYATLALKRSTPEIPAVFDFSLTVEAQANINITIKL